MSMCCEAVGAMRRESACERKIPGQSHERASQDAAKRRPTHPLRFILGCRSARDVSLANRDLETRTATEKSANPRSTAKTTLSNSAHVCPPISAFECFIICASRFSNIEMVQSSV